MANTYIASGTSFKPYSFAEMIQPYQMYTDAYNEADEQLNLLLEDAASKAFNFEIQDIKEKELYDNMMSNLKNASDALSNGDSNAFSTIRNINKEYKKTMIPIQQKIAKRAELVAEQRSKQLANPNIRFTVDFSKENLDNITNSSTYEIINLDDYEKSIATEFAGQVQSYVRNDLPLERIENTDHYVHTTGIGYTQQEFDDAFNGGPNGGPKTNSFVYKFYKQKADAIDARKDINNSIKTELKERLLEGMKANAGTFKSEVLKDPYNIHSKNAGNTAAIESRLKNTPVFVGAFDEDESGWPTKANYMINGTMHIAENIKWTDIDTEEVEKYREMNYPVYSYKDNDGNTKYKTIVNPAGFVKVGTQVQDKQDYETVIQEYGYNPSTKKIGWHDVRRETRKYDVPIPLKKEEEVNDDVEEVNVSKTFGKGRK